ncbi:hypothetical protein QBC37DRAFT_480322 [Rhypophila decipiens]|uniref:Uncharacterized protein n=1 Tax=Rhypophila decipiens TaxID=261697 RepID=A0AAN7BDB5_9PEZI|nr:hypothetical protein QBC37DRAFT_480322 [Rhypophila decipiens]
MMLTRSPLVLLVSLGALMTPVFAAVPSTTPTCGDDPTASVSCSASNKEWKCPPANTCGATFGECLMDSFPVCTPAAVTTSTKPIKTTVPVTPGGSSESKTTPTGTGTGTGTGAPASTNSPGGNGSGASGLGLSWTVAAGVMGMGVFVGGLVV